MKQKLHDCPPHQILGIPADATKRQAEKAYRRLAKQTHPDRDRSPGADERFSLLNEAYRAFRSEDGPVYGSYTETGRQETSESRSRSGNGWWQQNGSEQPPPRRETSEGKSRRFRTKNVSFRGGEFELRWVLWAATILMLVWRPYQILFFAALASLLVLTWQALQRHPQVKRAIWMVFSAAAVLAAGIWGALAFLFAGSTFWRIVGLVVSFFSLRFIYKNANNDTTLKDGGRHSSRMRSHRR